MKKLFLILFLAVIGLTANSYGQGSSNTAYIIPIIDSVNTRVVTVSDTVIWFKFATTDTAITANLTYPQGVTPPTTNIALYKMQSNSLVLMQQNNASASISYNNNTSDTSYIKIAFATPYTGTMYFNVVKVPDYWGIGARQTSLGGSFNQGINVSQGTVFPLITLCYNLQPIDLECIVPSDKVLPASYPYHWGYRFKSDGNYISNLQPISITQSTYFPYITTTLPVGVHPIELEIYCPNISPTDNWHGQLFTTIGGNDKGQFIVTILGTSTPNSDVLTIPATTCVGSVLYLTPQPTPGVTYTITANGLQHTGPSQFWTYICQSPGQYTVTATASSTCGGTSTTNYPLTVSTVPEIESVDTICPGDSINFYGLTCVDAQLPNQLTYYISSCTWLWNFGDGTTSTLRNPTHTYAAAGTYTVSFSIVYSGLNGISTETVTKTITVISPSIPVITGNHNNCDLTTTYSIDNPGVNSVYTWAFTPINPAATGNISGQGNPTISVDWNNPNGNNMNMGKLTVTNTENGCTSTSSIDIYKCCFKDGAGEENLHDIIITDPMQIPTNSFAINGTVTFNCNVALNNQFLGFGPYAKIIVSPGTTFTVDNVSFLTAGCEFMWDGIYVSDPTANVNIIGNSTAQDAINGVVSENGGNFTLKWANMNNNLYSVRVHNYTDPTPHTGTIINTHFNGWSSLLPPYAGQKTICGVESSWINGVLNIGDETDAANLNTFQNMRYGVYATNSNINVVNNKFLNIENGSYFPPYIPAQKIYPEGAVYATNSWPWFSIDIFGNSFTFTPAFDVKVGGNDLKRNYFDNCKTGVYTYKNLSTIENNNFKNCRHGIRSVDVADKSKYTNNTIYCDPGNEVTPGYGIDLRNVFSNPKGIGCLVDGNDIKNKYYGISLINISGNKTLRFADVNSNKIWFTVTTPTPASIIHTGIWAQNSNFSQIKFNRIERNVHAFAGLEDNNVLGIRIADCIEAKVMQNQINRMGSGILGHGGLTNTKFGCNSFYDNYYGLNFDWSASVSAQGALGLYNPDNGWYDGTQNGFKRIKLTLGTFNYYYDPTVMSVYDPNPAPFLGLVNPIPNIGVATLCVANPGSTGTGGNTGYEEPNFDVTARETAFGSIVRGEKLYAMLEEEYRQKDREYVYEMLRKYPEWINMGSQDDNVYFAFYNAMYQTDIEKVLEMRDSMYAQNYEYARAKLDQIADDSTINTNRKIAGSIYLDTWGSYKYELNDEQVDALSKIAYLTPYAGGDAVYTARVMLDINPDEIHLDYVKPPVHYPMQAKELNAVVFPNPAKDKITVKFTETIAADGIIEFYGMMGNLVYTTTITKGVAEMQININSVKSGLYFYTVKVNDTKITSGKITIVNK